MAKQSKKSVTMTKREFVAEHKELVDTLKHPTPAKLKQEAREQGAELKKVKRQK